MPTSVSTSVASGSHSASVSSSIGTTQQDRVQPPRQLPPKKSKEGVTRGEARSKYRPPASHAQGLLASDVCASTDVFAPKLVARQYILQDYLANPFIPPPCLRLATLALGRSGTLHWDETDRELDARRALARHQGRPCATSPLTQGLHITNGPFGCCRCRSRTDATGSPREQ